MDQEYVFRLKGGGWSKPVGIAQHMNAARKRIVTRDEPFVVTQDGDAISGRLKRDGALERYRKAIEDRELGATFRVRSKDVRANDAVAFTGRSMKEAPDAIDTNGNAHADEFWTWVVNTYGAFHPRFGGSYVCKTISGSGGVRSQHSYGNAVDIFFDSIAHQTAVFMDVTHGQSPVQVAHAISMRSIWEPGIGIHSYTGETHFHLHTDYVPQYAGSCGVRG